MTTSSYIKGLLLGMLIGFIIANERCAVWIVIIPSWIAGSMFVSFLKKDKEEKQNNDYKKRFF